MRICMTKLIWWNAVKMKCRTEWNCIGLLHDFTARVHLVKMEEQKAQQVKQQACLMWLVVRIDTDTLFIPAVPRENTTVVILQHYTFTKKHSRHAVCRHTDHQSHYCCFMTVWFSAALCNFTSAACTPFECLFPFFPKLPWLLIRYNEGTWKPN